MSSLHFLLSVVQFEEGFVLFENFSDCFWSVSVKHRDHLRKLFRNVIETAFHVTRQIFWRKKLSRNFLLFSNIFGFGAKTFHTFGRIFRQLYGNWFHVSEEFFRKICAVEDTKFCKSFRTLRKKFPESWQKASSSVFQTSFYVSSWSFWGAVVAFEFFFN